MPARPITIGDPRWSTTFPEIVAPRKEDDESLEGLLLRSDLANGWPPGTSLQLTSTGPRPQVKHPVMSGYNSEFDVVALANALALSPSDVRSTTYEGELTALYRGTATKDWIDLLGGLPPFQICPQCISNDHLLPRTHLLPGLFYCPKHNIKLCSSCVCGFRLEPFRAAPFPAPPRTPISPFVCLHCELPWESLPCEVDNIEALARDKQLFSWYEAFLARPVPMVLMRAMALLDHEPTAEHQRTTESWVQLVRDVENSYPQWSRFRSHALAYLCEYLVRDGFLPQCAAEDNFATCRRRYVIWEEPYGRDDLRVRAAVVYVPTSQLDEPCPCGDQTWREPLVKVRDRLGRPTHVLCKLGRQWGQLPVRESWGC